MSHLSATSVAFHTPLFAVVQIHWLVSETKQNAAAWVTHWHNVFWNIFPTLVRIIMPKIPTKPPEISKEKRKSRQTTRCFCSVSKVIPQCTAQLSSLATLVQKCAVLPVFGSHRGRMTSPPQKLQCRFENLQRPPHQGGLVKLVRSAFGAHRSPTGTVTPAQTNCTEEENEL